MLLEPRLILELALLGVATGFLAGLLGMGGAVLIVPFVTIILTSKGYPADYAVKSAIATSLATICLTSLSSLRAHHLRGAVRWPIVRTLAPGIVLGSLAGAQLAVHLPGKALSVLFALFLAFAATQMFRGREPKSSRGFPGLAGSTAAGGLIGVLASLVGAGGAFASVPFMIWCNVKIHDAVGTSAALGFPIAVAGTLGYLWAGRDLPPMVPGAVGYLYLPALIVISLGSMAMAPVGARTAHRMDIRPLRRIFAAVLYILAGHLLLR